MPSRPSAISPLTLATAAVTPLPPYRSLSLLSRSSTASNEPVDAPEGTWALPLAPDSRNTSTSTVGFPRESRTSRAAMCSMAVMVLLWLLLLVGKHATACCQGPLSPLLALDLVPEGVEAGQIQGRQAHAGPTLHGPYPGPEPGRGGAQRHFGVDPDVASHVDAGEQQVAELLFLS